MYYPVIGTGIKLYPLREPIIMPLTKYLCKTDRLQQWEMQ